MDKKENGSDRRYRKTNMVPNKHNSNERVLAVTLVDNQGLIEDISNYFVCYAETP